MITASFRRRQGLPCGVSVSGHAGWADAGQDIVCASVTSAVQLTANGITEVLGVKARVAVADNEIAIHLPEDAGGEAGRFLQALALHLELLRQDYPEHIQLTALEV